MLIKVFVGLCALIMLGRYSTGVTSEVTSVAVEVTPATLEVTYEPEKIYEPPQAYFQVVRRVLEDAGFLAAIPCDGRYCLYVSRSGSWEASLVEAEGWLSVYAGEIRSNPRMWWSFKPQDLYTGTNACYRSELVGSKGDARDCRELWHWLHDLGLVVW